MTTEQPEQPDDLAGAEEQMVRHELDAFRTVMIKLAERLPRARTWTQDEVDDALRQLYEDDPEGHELLERIVAFRRFGQSTGEPPE